MRYMSPDVVNGITADDPRPSSQAAAAFHAPAGGGYRRHRPGGRSQRAFENRFHAGRRGSRRRGGADGKYGGAYERGGICRLSGNRGRPGRGRTGDDRTLRPRRALGGRDSRAMMDVSPPEPITAEHDVEAFSCGKAALDAWLKTRALANQAKGFTVGMVVHEAGRVVGYYGLAPTAVPCLLLGQLATDRNWAVRGIGAALLGHALRRCVLGARLIGGRAVVVNAIDAEASAFWRRRGFIAGGDDPMVLFRSIADIAESLRLAGATASRRRQGT